MQSPIASVFVADPSAGTGAWVTVSPMKEEPRPTKRAKPPGGAGEDGRREEAGPRRETRRRVRKIVERHRETLDELAKQGAPVWRPDLGDHLAAAAEILGASEQGSPGCPGWSSLSRRSRRRSPASARRTPTRRSS